MGLMDKNNLNTQTILQNVSRYVLCSFTEEIIILDLACIVIRLLYVDESINDHVMQILEVTRL